MINQKGVIGYFLVVLSGIIMILFFLMIIQILPKAAPNYDRFTSFFRNRQDKERQSLAQTPKPVATSTSSPSVCFYYDLNNDNKIDNLDVLVIQYNIGVLPQSKNWNPKLDFNRDGRVDNTDVTIAQILANANLLC